MSARTGWANTRSDVTDPFQPGLLARLPHPPRKVAIVRASRLGDFLCATPTFRALRQALPRAEITLIGLPLARELVARSPSLDRFVAFPGCPGIADQFFDARRMTSFLLRMQAERYDLALQLHGSGVLSNPATLLLGARATAGFVRPGDGASCLDAALPWPAELHEVRRLLALTTFLGAPPRGEQLDFRLLPEDHQAAAALLAGARLPLIGVHPSATDPIKRWPPQRFAAAAAALQQRIGGTVILLCSAADREVAHRVADAVPGPCLDLSGRTSVPVLGAVIARLGLLLTNDSGPAHLAYALGTPVVTIFGGTEPETWGPLAHGAARVLAAPAACRPCHAVTCPVGYSCLEGVTVEAAVDAGLEIVR